MGDDPREGQPRHEDKLARAASGSDHTPKKCTLPRIFLHHWPLGCAVSGNDARGLAGFFGVGWTMTTTHDNQLNQTYWSRLPSLSVVVKVVVNNFVSSKNDVSAYKKVTCHRSSVGRAAVL